MQLHPSVAAATRLLYEQTHARPEWLFLDGRLRVEMLVAFALVFLAVVNELTATLLLSPAGTGTLATRFWSLSLDLDYAAAAPFAAIMIVMSAPVTYLLLRQATAGGR